MGHMELGARRGRRGDAMTGGYITIVVPQVNPTNSIGKLVIHLSALHVRVRGFVLHRLTPRPSLHTDSTLDSHYGGWKNIAPLRRHSASPMKGVDVSRPPAPLP